MRHGIIVGDKFGEWTVIGLQKGQQNILVVCSCGKSKAIDSYALKAGKSTRCRSCATKYGMANKNRRITDDTLAFNKLYDEYRRRETIKRGFDLTKPEFRAIVTSDCHYCDAEPAQKMVIWGKDWALPFIYNGIDRFDSTMGYTLGNSVPCCGMCNYMKRALPYDKFVEHMRKIITKHELTRR